MKNFKLTIIALTITFYVPILANIETEEMIQAAIKREQYMEALKERRAEEAKLKSLKKTAGNKIIATLLNTESNISKKAVLDTLPFEMREYLFELIDIKKGLLDEKEQTDKDMIQQLNNLEDFIAKNLREALSQQK